MMEENNNIFLAGGNALVYLAKPMHEKYSTTFVWGHPFSRYLMTNFSTPLPLYIPVHNLMTPLHSPSCVRTWPSRFHGIRGIGAIRGK